MEPFENEQGNRIFDIQHSQNQPYQVEEYNEQNPIPTDVPTDNQQGYINYLYQQFLSLMDQLNKYPFILPDYDTFKHFILNYGQSLLDRGFNVPILYYGDPNQLTMESILNAPIIMDELYNHETFIQNNCDNLIIKEDINNYIVGLMIFNEQTSVQQQCVQFDSTQIDHSNSHIDEQSFVNQQSDINQISVEHSTHQGNESVLKARVFETEGGIIPDTIVTTPLSRLEVIPVQRGIIRTVNVQDLPSISLMNMDGIPGKRPRGKGAKSPKGSKIIRLPNIDKTKEKAPKKNAKKTPIGWNTNDEEFLNQIRDGLKDNQYECVNPPGTADQMVLEEKKNEEIQTFRADQRGKMLDIVISDASENLESSSMQLPDSFERITHQFLNPNNVYVESMNRAQVILNKRTDSKKNKFWILKENIKSVDDEFPRNYVSINWAFSGRKVVHKMYDTLFLNLSKYYYSLKDTEFIQMAQIKQRLYSTNRKFFNVLLPIKCFRLSDNSTDINSSESFNVLLSVLRLIKGFKRKFNIQCIVSYYHKGSLKNLIIHIKQIEGVNILIGEQIFEDKKYPFFMTTEEILFEHDSRGQRIESDRETFVFTNMITPDDIKVNDLVNLKGNSEKIKTYMATREKPSVIGEKGVEYPEIFTTTLKKWTLPQTYGIITIREEDEPILNLPETKDEISKLYQIPIVKLGDDIYPIKNNKNFDFIFKIVFQYSYYTKDRDWMNREIVIENVIENVDNGICPFILKDEYDKILKIIYSYCKQEDQDTEDTCVQSESQHIDHNEENDSIKVIDKKIDQFSDLPPPILENNVINQQPNGYNLSYDTINLHVDSHSFNSKPKLISINEMFNQPAQSIDSLPVPQSNQNQNQNPFNQPFDQLFGSSFVQSTDQN